MTHPHENDLALLAGGETAGVRRLLLERHIRGCTACQEKIAEYGHLRAELAGIEMPDLNWNSIAAEMQANVRLGLEAGACVGAAETSRRWNPRLAVAFASVLLLVAAGFFGRNLRLPSGGAAPESAAAVLRLTGAGIELRTGNNMLMLLNHHGAAADQTVSARGEMGASYIDGETGSVTITNAYLPQ